MQHRSITKPASDWWRNRRLQLDFARHLWGVYRSDESLQSAAALSYASLLALVPLLAVILGTLSTFPVRDDIVERIQDFIFANFVPASGETVQTYVQQFLDNTAALTGPGTLFLIITALLLMAGIEQTFNRIWRVTTARSFSSRLVMYWSILTLGSLFMGGSVALSSYLATLAIDAAGGGSVLLRFAPFLVAWLGFALLYTVVPNRSVKLREAAIGALFAALLFELAKQGFVLYLTHFPTYQKLYGALATIPIFLVWIYVTWNVTLLGATLAAAITTFHFRRSEWQWPRRLELALQLRILRHIYRSPRGRGLNEAELLDHEPAASDAQLRELLRRMRDAGLVCRAESGEWLIGTDLERVTLADLYQAAPTVLPILDYHEIPEETATDSAVRSALADIASASEANLQRSLKSYVCANETDHGESA